MGDPAAETRAAGSERASPAGGRRVFILWTILAVAALLLAAGAVGLRLIAGPAYDGLLMLAACLAAVLLALRLPNRNAGSAAAQKPANDAGTLPSQTQEILDSAGTAVVAVGLDRTLIYVNPAGERLLGSDASELVNDWSITDFLAPGEGARLVKEMEKLCGVDRP